MIGQIRALSLLSGLGILLLAGCSGKGVPINPPTPLSDVDPSLMVEHRWVRQLGKGSDQYHLKLRPLVDGERVFQASHRGEVAAMDAASGSQLWRVSVDSRINTGPADAGDWLLLGAMSEVIALHKDDGAVVWRSPVNTEVLSMPAWHREVVVIHAGDGSVVGINSQTGEPLWQHRESVPSLSLRGTGNPVIVGDEGVLVGTASGKLIALSLHEGELLWQTEIASPRGRSELERIADVDADLAGGDGVVYASSYQGVLAEVNIAGGQLGWNREIASSTGITIDERQLYVTDRDGNVWALSRRDGRTMWRQQALAYRGLSAPVQQGDYLIVGDYEGYLHWLHKEDGRLVARARVQDWREYWPVGDLTPLNEGVAVERAILMPPMVRGNWVYASDKRGVLDVFEVSLVEDKDAK